MPLSADQFVEFALGFGVVRQTVGVHPPTNRVCGLFRVAVCGEAFR